jgi:chitodextrinase
MTAKGLSCYRSMIPTLVFIAVAIFATSPVDAPVNHGAARIQVGSRPAILPASTDRGDEARIAQNYAALPLVFEKNEGQTDPQVKYVAQTNNYTIFLTPNDAVLSFHASSRSGIRADRRRELPQQKVQSAMESSSAVRMHMVGANSGVEMAASDKLGGQTNYYIGNDPTKWQPGVSHYGRVTYKNIYPGIDMAFHGRQRQVEFDFIVAPGASPKPIEMSLTGAQRIWTDASGNLLLSSAAGNLVLHKPTAYQEKENNRQLVDARFILKDKSTVALNLGPYDRTHELVIDPALSYSTYLGGSVEEEGFAIAVDALGDAYITGQTNSLDFPGVVGTDGGFDAFVTKLDSSGSLVFTTRLGGTMDDAGLGIAVNNLGVYVIGNTSSSNFPSLTAIGPRGGQDVFVVRLDSSSGMVSTERVIIAGSNVDSGNSIVVDDFGDAYIGGQTSSSDFPTASPIQAALAGSRDGFVAELDPTGTTLLYSTYLGGSSEEVVTGIALAGGNAYVTGLTNSNDFPVTTGAFQQNRAGLHDSFVTEIKADGSAWVYSTYLGGTGADNAFSIAVDAAGEAYVTGTTDSDDFPTLNAAQGSRAGSTDAFVAKLDASGSGLLFSTYLGGRLGETATSIALDPFNDAYVTGFTSSSDFPVAGSPFQPHLSGTSDAFVTELSNTGFVVYSSYLGGAQGENSALVGSTGVLSGAIAVDLSGNAYLTGSTDSTMDFPTQSAFQGAYAGGAADAFVTKVAAAPADFSIAISPSSISTTSGLTSAPVTVTVSSVNASFGGAVNLSCSGKPPLAGCNFVATSLTPTSTPVTTHLTISTNGSAGNGSLSPLIVPKSGIFYALLLPLGGLALVGTGFGRGRTQRVLGLVLFGMVGATFLLSCGGGTSTSPSPSPRASCSAAPSAPTGLATSSITTTGTSLNWSAASAPASCSVSAYTVYQNGKSIGTTPNTNFAVTGLSPGTAYSFTVAASDAFGPSAQSSPVPVTTGASCSAAPSAPTGLAASSTTTTGTSLNWSAARAPSGCSIASYTIYQNGTSIGTTTNTNFDVTGLSPGTTYNFTVAASDAFGASEQSSAAKVTTGTQNTPPGTYTITVTGTDANNPSHSHSVQLTLTVK